MVHTGVEYTPGQLLAVVTPATVVVVDAPTDWSLAGPLWELALDDAPIDEILDCLIRRGIRTAPVFAVVRVEETAVRVLVRGEVRVGIERSGDPVRLDASGATTWLEAVVSTPRRVLVGSVDATTRPPYLVATGVVLASGLVLPCTQEAAQGRHEDAGRAAGLTPDLPNQSLVSLDSPASRERQQPPAVVDLTRLEKQVRAGTAPSTWMAPPAPMPDIPVRPQVSAPDEAPRPAQEPVGRTPDAGARPAESSTRFDAAPALAFPSGLQTPPLPVTPHAPDSPFGPDARTGPDSPAGILPGSMPDSPSRPEPVRDLPPAPDSPANREQEPEFPSPGWLPDSPSAFGPPSAFDSPSVLDFPSAPDSPSALESAPPFSSPSELDRPSFLDAPPSAFPAPLAGLPPAPADAPVDRAEETDEDDEERPRPPGPSPADLPSLDPPSVPVLLPVMSTPAPVFTPPGEQSDAPDTNEAAPEGDESGGSALGLPLRVRGQSMPTDLHAERPSARPVGAGGGVNGAYRDASSRADDRPLPERPPFERSQFERPDGDPPPERLVPDRPPMPRPGSGPWEGGADSGRPVTERPDLRIVPSSEAPSDEDEPSDQTGAVIPSMHAFFQGTRVARDETGGNSAFMPPDDGGSVPSPTPSPKPSPAPGVLRRVPDVLGLPANDRAGEVKAPDRAVPTPPGARREPPRLLGVWCDAGHVTSPDAPDCRVCGLPVPPQAPILVVRPPLGTLVFDSGERVPIERPIILGRDPKPVPSPDPDPAVLHPVQSATGQVSRTHAEVRVDGWNVVVTDLEAMNGTTITVPGGEPEPLEPGVVTAITGGTRVDLGGETGFVFEVDG